MPTFKNRTSEMAALRRWWDRPHGRPAILWGRRRVGKTWILREFAKEHQTIFHTGATRPLAHELSVLSEQVAACGAVPFRDLARAPFTNWDEALGTLAQAATDHPLVLVLDEFPELLRSDPSLPSVLRAFLDRTEDSTKLRLLLCGSAVRVMEQLQQERAPLFGRFDLALLVHPFTPHESALLLPKLDPPTRALVWGLLGGVPLYLSWWDQERSIKENLQELVCTPGGRLLYEGQLLLATEGEPGTSASAVLSAIALGRTKHNEIADAVGIDPTRTLERLIELRLIERVVPVTEDPRKSRRRIYRIADNFLSFWLGTIQRYQGEIERGLGPGVLNTIITALDDHLGPCWEEAFRSHLRLLASLGQLHDDVVAVGSYWQDNVTGELDAVMLAGRSRTPVLVGEAKWGRSVDARPIERALLNKAVHLPGYDSEPRLSIAARETVNYASEGTLVVTAADIFGDPAAKSAISAKRSRKKRD